MGSSETFMGKFFARNLTVGGRIVRAIWGLLLVGTGLYLLPRSRWASGALLVAGAFAFFEAARGWCIMRACGVKTRL
jgi:hypothetical protein